MQDGKRPLLLTLQQQDGGGLRVEMKTIPQALLVAERPKEKPAEPSMTPARARSTTAPPTTWPRKSNGRCAARSAMR